MYIACNYKASLDVLNFFIEAYPEGINEDIPFISFAFQFRQIKKPLLFRIMMEIFQQLT